MKWEAGWIEVAKELVRDEFERSYAGLDTDGEDTTDNLPTKATKVRVTTPPTFC